LQVKKQRLMMSVFVMLMLAISSLYAADSQGMNEFGFDLLHQLDGGQQNVFFSSFSVYEALAMPYAGARSITLEQMARVLHGDEQVKSTLENLKAINEEVHGRSREGEAHFDLANGIWVQRGFSVLPAFREYMREFFNSALEEADFEQSAEEARITINRWVAGITSGLIPDLIPQGILNAETRMVLVNAIYFKGYWKTPFDKNRTHDAPFTKADGTECTVSMMEKTGYYPYAETDAGQLIELPYKGYHFSMVILLPEKGTGLKSVNGQLSAGKLSSLLGALQSTRVNVQLPKFKSEQGTDLAKTLAGMGMPYAFNSSADFSGISGQPDLYIANVIHRAVIIVDEAGSEAAAATAVVMNRLSMAPENPPVEFTADRPFLYLIRERNTGTILFMGCLYQP
jgi:serpin B